MKIGFVVAFEAEIGQLSEHGEIKTVCGIRITERDFGDNHAVIALSGIGKANAAACTQVLISVFGCEAILNIGLAGNACDLPLGGAVVADRTVYHDIIPADFVSEDSPWTSEFTPDGRMAALSRRILDELGCVHIDGTVATGDQFIGDNATKRSIIERTGCACVEMEGAAIAHVAMKNETPFCLVKIISDNADDEADDQFKETVSISSYLSTSTGFIRRFAEDLSF